MKTKQIYSFFIFTILTALTSFFCACTPDWVNRQSALKNVLWESTNTQDIETPVLKFLVLQENAYHFGTVAFNGQEYDIAFDWGNTRFDISLVNYYGEITEENQDKKISGTYKIVKDNEVKLVINYDTIFDEMIKSKEITVKAIPVDEADYSVMDRHEICWKTENFEVCVYQNYRHFGVGNYQIGETKKEIVFYWLANNRFEIYTLTDRKQDLTSVATGTYIDNINSITLLFQTNTLLEDVETLVLIGEEITKIPNSYWYPEE